MAKKYISRADRRRRRHTRVRRKVSGTATCPRMAVCKTGRHLYVQLIDDVAGHTLVSASTLDSALRGDQAVSANQEGAAAIGRLAAERAKEKGVTSVVFDRGGFPFHGCIKALADAARESGLEF
jgi:large subunit ribosomal protein L18